MNAQAMMNKIKDGQLDDAFRRVYVTDGEVAKQKSRYMELLTTFAETFGGDREVHLMSAPGRTEICGNHTDHNHGKVLAAAINLDAIAVASKNEDGVVRVKSAGHQMNVADLADLAPTQTPLAILRLWCAVCLRGLVIWAIPSAATMR